MPIERVFDASAGDLLVQRCMGCIAGRKGATLVHALEYAILRFRPKLLLVLGESESAVVRTALKQIDGDAPVPTAARTVLDRVLVSAMRAANQVNDDDSLTAAGREMHLKQLAVELNVLYTIQQLLCSRAVREAVRGGGLELHGAVLDELTGEVEMIGRHPQEDNLLDEAQYDPSDTAPPTPTVVRRASSGSGRVGSLSPRRSASLPPPVDHAHRGSPATNAVRGIFSAPLGASAHDDDAGPPPSPMANGDGGAKTVDGAEEYM